MKTILSALALLVSMGVGAQANAQYPIFPEDEIGWGPGGDVDGFFGEDLCSGTINGTFVNDRGREVRVRIDIDRAGGERVRVSVERPNGVEYGQGVCRYNPNGSTTLQFQAESVSAALRINENGRARGTIRLPRGDFDFTGRMSGVGQRPPQPPPMPRPPRPPQPPPQFDPCVGTINGTWGYKGGRWMTLTLTRQGGRNVAVVVSHKNGSAVSPGTCRPSGDGSASLAFDGGGNNGNLYIGANGQVSGQVSGHSFVGQK